VHFRFFRSGAFAAGTLGTFTGTLVLFGAYYFFNLFLQSFVVFDFSPLEAGAALLPMSLTMFGVSLAAGPVAQRVGPRAPVTLGFLSICLGFLLVSQIGPGSGATDLIPGFVLIGAGQGLVTGPTSAAAVASVPEEDAGEAAGVVNMGRYLGGSLGVAICGLLYLNTGVSRLNAHLPGAGKAEEHSLDSVLSGAADTARDAVTTLPHGSRAPFVLEARHAAVDAFAATNRVLAALAGATAVLCLLLLRPRGRERHHPAHLAAGVHTAHHQAADASTSAR
jgi:MFS family permease